MSRATMKLSFIKIQMVSTKLNSCLKVMNRKILKGKLLSDMLNGSWWNQIGNLYCLDFAKYVTVHMALQVD